MAKNNKKHNHFVRIIRLDPQGYSKRKFKAGRKWVKLRIDATSKMIYIVEARTHEILDKKQFTGQNEPAFRRAAKSFLQKYLGIVFPKMRKPHFKGNISEGWVKE